MPTLPGVNATLFTARARSTFESLRWPLSALLAWGLCWALYLMLLPLAVPVWAAASLAGALGLVLALLGRSRMRAATIAGGFPLSLLSSDAAAAFPAWSWLLPLALLLLLYPRRAWRDAPLFPTPPGSLDPLATQVKLAARPRVLDAGCGLGHGLHALRRAFPQARIDGVEWSWPLALLARLRCRFAAVRRADMWSQSWRCYDLVYLFQRPESMARALAKAHDEMVDGSWLASLEFEAGDWLPQAVMTCADGRPLWLYRLPLRPTPAAARALQASTAPGSAA